MDAADRQARFEGLAAIAELSRRRLAALALLTDRLAEDDIQPILVGGAAVDFYTAGGYSTGDVDLALPTTPAVDAAFSEFGFRKIGRFWLREDLDLLFEAPARAGLPGETAPRTMVEVDGLPVVVIGVEDLLLDRLRAAVHWRSGEDQRWAKRLAVLYRESIDWSYLTEKAVEGEERDALAALRREVESP